MSSEQEQIRSIAERIARRIAVAKDEQEGAGAAGVAAEDLAALRAGLSEIQRRLAHLESHLNHDENCETQEPRGHEASRPERGGEGQYAATPQTQTDASSNATRTRSPWLSGTYVPATAHPSDERFGIGEAVSEIVDYFEREKTCNMEPGNKPCDHCAMCSSRTDAEKKKS